MPSDPDPCRPPEDAPARLVARRPGLIAAALGILATAVGVAAMSRFVHQHGGGDLLLVLAPQAAVLLAVGAIMALGRWSPAACGMARPRLRDCLAGLALAPALAVSGYVLMAGMVLACGPPPPAIERIDRLMVELRDHYGWGWLIAATCLLPGLVEEAMLRGVVLSGLRRRCSGDAAVVLAALAFAVLHLSPWRLLPQLVLGLVAGWLALRTRSCWPGAVAHAAYNTLVIGISLRIDPAHLARTVAVLVLVAPFGIWLAWWLLSEREARA